MASDRKRRIELSVSANLEDQEAYEQTPASCVRDPTDAAHALDRVLRSKRIHDMLVETLSYTGYRPIYFTVEVPQEEG